MQVETDETGKRYKPPNNDPADYIFIMQSAGFLFNYARRHGIAVNVLSGRRNEDRTLHREQAECHMKHRSAAHP